MEDKRQRNSHYKFGINRELVPKQAFKTEEEALRMARFLNTKDNVIHKMCAYKCLVCGKWHIGKTGKELTEKDREHAKKMLSIKYI